MRYSQYDNGYGVAWDEVCVYHHEGYGTSVSDYHEHPFYEVNLVLSGEVKVLLRDRIEQGAGNRVILTAPDTPHYISCDRGELYKRLYLLFTEEFVSVASYEWKELLSVFGESGRCVTLTAEQTDACRNMIEQIGREQSRLRQQLLTFYFLSYLKDCSAEQADSAAKLPRYMMDAIAYIERNYGSRIVAAELAQRLYIGRTSLMVGFKQYMGMTINEYVRRCRIRGAVELLRQGIGEQEVAERCGFCDASSMIKCFRQFFGMTPRQYCRSHPLSLQQ